MKPNYIIGHSVGKLCCAYADQCNSVEEVIEAACSREMAQSRQKIAVEQLASTVSGLKKF